MLIKINYIIKYFICILFFLILIMMINHFYVQVKIRNKHIMGLDKSFLNWSIDNHRSGLMSAIYSYDCSDELFKLHCENIALSISTELKSGKSIWNRNIDFKKRK